MLLLWGKVYAVHSIEQADPIQSFNKLEHRSWAENNRLDRRTDIFEVGKATVPAISPLHLGALPSGLAIDCTVRAARCTMGLRASPMALWGTSPVQIWSDTWTRIII